MNDSNRRYVRELAQSLIEQDILPVIVVGSGPLPDDRLVILMPLLTEMFNKSEAREMLVSALETLDKAIAEDLPTRLFQKVTKPQGPRPCQS